MSIEANKAIGPRFFGEQDRLRGGPAAELCAPNYVAYLAGFPPMDRAGHEQFAGAFYAGFPDLYHTVDDVVATEDKVATRFTVRGTHTGDFLGIPATNKAVTISAMAIMRIEDGQVAELHSVFDQMGLMRQLGVAG